MFYDQNQSRIIMSYPALLAAYPGAGDLSTEPARNALGLGRALPVVLIEI